MPWPKSLIGVICTANVCRSPYAAALLAAGLGDRGVATVGAGLAVDFRLGVCPSVETRLDTSGFAAPAVTSSQITRDLVDRSALILTMTTEHRAAIGRITPSARARTFTLIEATVLAEALRDRSPAPQGFLPWCVAVAAMRGQVPMPMKRVSAGRWLRRRPAEHLADISITDGHISERVADHEATLDQVEGYCDRLVAAARPVLVADSGRTR